MAAQATVYSSCGIENLAGALLKADLIPAGHAVNYRFGDLLLNDAHGDRALSPWK